MKKNLSDNGFTLIELLIALAIAAILASVATSYYGDYVKSSKCIEGRSVVLERSTSLQKCQAVYGVYNNNCTIKTGTTSGGNFDITLARTATTFTVTATATGGAGPANPFCTTITLNNLGVQGGTGSAPW